MTTCLAAGPVQAGSLAYPAVVGPDGVFNSIVETSITDTPPLYGSPTAGLGNSMDFQMTGFTATAVGDTSDITSGALEFTFQADLGKLIQSISLFESGTFSIMTLGGVSAGGTVTVRYYDELAQTFVTLAEPIVTTVPPDAQFPVIGAGDGVWYGTALIDFTTLQIETSQIIVALDNTLIAQACACGSATISKDTMTIHVETTPSDIPEPASIVLTGAGLAMILRKRS